MESPQQNKSKTGREKWIRNKLLFRGRKQKDTFHMGRLTSTLFNDTPRENIPPNINKLIGKQNQRMGRLKL